MESVIAKTSSILLMISVFLIVTVSAGPTITCTGNMNDWGLAQLNDPLSPGAWSINETWTPLAGVSYIVEDNYNPLSGSLTYSGVHIIGTGSSFLFYNEPQVLHKNSGNLVWEPFGYEPYDLEAIYFTQDSNNLYVAIISSLQQTGIEAGEKMPGDLALNFGIVPGEDLDCEYGIKLNLYTAGGAYQVGDIVYLPKWSGQGYLDPPKPDFIIGHNVGGGVVGQAVVHYDEMLVDDKGHPNYFIEICIPKSTVGVSGPVSLQNIYYYDNCLNDHFYVPEFPAFSLLFGIIFGCIGVIYLIKSRN